jgi:hypothetical protein
VADAAVLARACAILHAQRQAVREERRAYWNCPPGTHKMWEVDGWRIVAAFDHRFDALRDAEHQVQRMRTVSEALQCPDALVRSAAILALSE